MRLILFFSALMLTLFVHSQDTSTIQKAVLDAFNDDIDKKSAYQKTLEEVISLKAKKSFSGRANFGFNGETTRDENNSLFNLFGGITLDWDLYPGELDFYTSFGVTISDGELQENVSRIDISYDYLQTNIADGLLLENFVYINRSTDAYIGIEQRYELGGGLIINHWIKKLISPANEKLAISFNKKDDNNWAFLANHGVDDDSYESFKQDYKEAYHKNRKANSKLRLALLTGLFFELEKTSVNAIYELDATYNFRWMLRPTMDVHLKDGWKIKLRPYFKLPMPWQWKNEVADSFGNVDKRADYLVDFTANVTTQLASKRVQISFIYNLIYDNAPARLFVEDNNSSELIVNNDLHQSFRMSVSVGLTK